MDRLLKMDSSKAREMLARLETAVSEHKIAMEHLTRAISETEASRQALHEAGLQCWIDKLDGENGH